MSGNSTQKIGHFVVSWIDRGREPTVKPDPAFPEGRDMDLRPSAIHAGCALELPYPAPRCGVYMVTCQRCSHTSAITVAGRPDDPRRLMIPCKPKGMN